MNTYWVYENIRKQSSFYNKLDVLLLLSSGRLWKKHHPSHNCIIYVDTLTHNLLIDLNATHLWDEIRILPENKFVDKSVFWASSKLEVLRYVEGPSIIMDHDFLVYTSIEEHLGNKILITVEENGIDYYPTGYDPFMRAVKKELPRPESRAINCSFLYFPTNSFCNFYARESLNLMNKFTKLKVPNSKYLLVSEQLLLKHLMDKYNIQYTSLLKAEWMCKNREYVPYPKGIFSLDESNIKFRHYWMDKTKIKESKEGFNLEEEVRILKNILAGKEINFSIIDAL